MVHNPFTSGNIKSYFFATNIRSFSNYFRHRKRARGLFRLSVQIPKEIDLLVVEFENFDLFKVFEALGGIIELLFVISGFLISPYNHRAYLKEQQEFFLDENSGEIVELNLEDMIAL